MNLIEHAPADGPAPPQAGRVAGADDDHVPAPDSLSEESSRQSTDRFLGLRKPSRHGRGEAPTIRVERPTELEAGGADMAGSSAASQPDKYRKNDSPDAPTNRPSVDAMPEDDRNERLAKRIASLRLVENKRTDDGLRWSFIKNDEEQDKIPAPDLQGPATRDDVAPSVHDQTVPDDAASALRAALSKRYLIADDKYFFRDRQQILAFEDSGKRVATVHDAPDVVHSMIDLAQAKGWTGIRLKGSEAFKREGWLEASLRGMEVSGFRPKENDKARLAELQAQIGTYKPNVIERTALPSRSPEPSPDKTDATDHSTSAPSGHSKPRLNKRHREELEMLKTLLRDRGDSDKAVELTATLASEQLLAHRYYVGKLVNHGASRYQHDPEEQMSYFVVLDTPRGEKTIWGVDLQRAVADAQVEPGTDVVLSHAGRTGVTVPKRERMEDGKARGPLQWESAMRNEWEITTIDSMRDLAAERAVAARLDQVAPLTQGKGKEAPTRAAGQQQEPLRSPMPEDREPDRSMR